MSYKTTNKLLRAFTALQQRIERAKEAVAAAKGEEMALLKQMKKEFGVGTLSKAKQLLVKKEKELAKLQADADKALKAFEKKYGDLVEGDIYD